MSYGAKQNLESRQRGGASEKATAGILSFQTLFAELSDCSHVCVFNLYFRLTTVSENIEFCTQIIAYLLW